MQILAQGKPYLNLEHFASASRFLQEESRAVKTARSQDYLSQLPKPDTKYVDEQGVTVFDRSRFDHTKPVSSYRRRKGSIPTAGISKEVRHKFLQEKKRREIVCLTLLWVESGGKCHPQDTSLLLSPPVAVTVSDGSDFRAAMRRSTHPA
jgi:hypothetical protein